MSTTFICLGLLPVIKLATLLPTDSNPFLVKADIPDASKFPLIRDVGAFKLIRVVLVRSSLIVGKLVYK